MLPYHDCSDDYEPYRKHIGYNVACERYHKVYMTPGYQEHILPCFCVICWITMAEYATLS